MNIALATSADRESWYKDIYLLQAALVQLGCAADIVVWDDKNIQWATYDAVVIDSTWDYVSRIEDYIGWCEHVNKVSLLINDLHTINLTINKKYLLHLQQSGIATPNTSLIVKNNIDPTLAIKHTNKVVVKPVIGAEGVHTYLFNSCNEALQSQVLNDLLLSKELLIQDYLPEIRTNGEYSSIFIDGKLSHSVIKKPTGKEFRVQHVYGGIHQLIKNPDNVQSLYNKILNALNCSPLYCRLDYVVTSEPIVMEVEMLEPEKFLSIYPKSVENLATAILRKLSI